MFVRKRAWVFQQNFPRELLRNPTGIYEGLCWCVKLAEFNSMFFTWKLLKQKSITIILILGKQIHICTARKKIYRAEVSLTFSVGGELVFTAGQNHSHSGSICLVLCLNEIPDSIPQNYCLKLQVHICTNKIYMVIHYKAFHDNNKSPIAVSM